MSSPDLKTTFFSDTSSLPKMDLPRTLSLANGSSLHHIATCASTMDEARILARNGAPHLTTVWAETQTAGRGRQGKSWLSPVNGLYFTLIVRPEVEIEPQRLGLLPLLVGAVLCSVVRERTGVQAALKWPNDLLGPDGRKLAGILAERDAISAGVLVGIGLNIRRQAFEANATSLEEYLGSSETDLNETDSAKTARVQIAEIENTRGYLGVNRTELLLAVLEQLETELRSLALGPQRTLLLWNAMQCTLGRQVSVLHSDGSRFNGRALNITHSGSLQIETVNGIQEISSGEVSLRLE
jgi:BirA family transcriptional regulator, biotin operon repressor / biotin---[acetyl-CoA-carboxylase] ligase